MLLKKYAPSFFIPILGSLLVLGCDAEEVVQSEQVIENPLPTNQSLSRQYELADPECLV